MRRQCRKTVLLSRYMGSKQNNERNNDHDGEQGEDEDPGGVYDTTCDTEPVPAKVLQKLTQWRPTLRTLWLMYRPTHASRTSYRTIRRALHYQPPTDIEPFEIGQTCMGLVRDILRGWTAGSGEAPHQWRLKARIRERDADVFRFVDFISSSDEEACFEDADNYGPDGGEPAGNRAAVEAMEQALELAMRAVGALVKTGEHFAKMGECVTTIATGAATLATQSGAGLAQVMQIQADLEKTRLETIERSEGADRMARTVETLITPVMPQIVSLFRRAGPPSADAESKTGGPKTRQLAVLLRLAGRERWSAVLDLCTPAEQTVLGRMLRATDDHTLAEDFCQLQKLWEPRWDTLSPAILAALGDAAPAFIEWALAMAT